MFVIVDFTRDILQTTKYLVKYYWKKRFVTLICMQNKNSNEKDTSYKKN